MTTAFADRVRVTSTTIGTGNFTLGAVVAGGFQAFSEFADATVVGYTIVHANGAQWEVGEGTVTAAGATLERTAIVSSSNADATVDFSNGDKDVFCSLNGQLLTTAIADLAAAPKWAKVSTDHAALAAAATSSDIELLSLAAGGVVHAVKIKHSTAAVGGAIASYTISVGIGGDLAKYATAFDVFQAVSDTTFQLSGGFFTENHGAATSLRLAAVSTGANLDQATAGDFDVWVLQSVVV
jgi:hypothetical protein